jgi:hypothetical protein
LPRPNLKAGSVVISMNANDSKRRGRAVFVLLALILVLLAAAGLVSAFKLGVATGMAGAGAGLIAYHVPALIFDWPRLTFGDVLAFIEAVIDWIVGLFSW